MFSGGADKVGKMFDVNSGTQINVAIHDAPISGCRWVDGAGGMQNIVATGSWDKTLKYWDLRQPPSPIHTIPLPERCYSMDCAFPLLAIACADRQIMIFNLNNPMQPYKTIQSPLKWQTKVISCFPNAAGFAIGSIEGRVGIQYIEDKDASLNFSFKCHRDDKMIYSVNSIAFHPVYGTFSTSGSDGNFNFWDKDSKQRLKTFSNIGGPITASCFNRNGSIFAYSLSYDWSKGHEYHQPGFQNKIFLHATTDEDIKPRPSKKR